MLRQIFISSYRSFDYYNRKEESKKEFIEFKSIYFIDDRFVDILLYSLL
jgi:hypothetical protein